MLYELSCHFDDGASFITLTYDEDHIPEDNGLQKKELQDFWKRLRKNLSTKYHEFAPKIKYYACGEYGDKEKIYFSPGAVKPHGRPHYHAIVFGLNNWNDEHRDILAKSWTNCEPWFFSKERGKDSCMQEVTANDIQYVCGYVQKKLYGQMGKNEYGQATPPFSTCSEGLGLEFAMKNKERLMNNGYTYFKGHKIGIPRYFCEKFGVNKSELIQVTPTVESVEKSNKLLFQKFEKDMREAGTWYPENKPMLERRFLIWYERKLWTYAKDIEKEYEYRAKMRGKL